MTITTEGTTIHRVLRELGLPLPMAPDTSWTLTALSDDESGTLACRLTLTDAGDLLVEVPADGTETARYGFDADGRLVSLSHSDHFAGGVFEALREQILFSIGRQCRMLATGPNKPGTGARPR